MVAVHGFATRKTGVAGLLWCDAGVRATGAKESLSKTVGEQGFADVVGAREQVGVTHLLCGKGAAQQVDGVFVTDDVPAGLGWLLGFHEDMVAEMGGNGKLILLYTT
jgi:hypothetical protein